MKNHIFLIRHGKKDVEEKLTQKGFEEARRFGEERITGAILEVFVSDENRAKDTAKEIIKGAGPLELVTRPSLSASTSKLHNVESDFFKMVDRTTVKARLSNDRKELDKIESENMKQWIEFDKERPDKGTLSPFEVARPVGKLIIEELKKLQKGNYKKHVDILNVTHEFKVASFIRYFVKKTSEDKVLNGKDVLGEIGYRIPPLEGLRLNIKRDFDFGEDIEVDILGEKYEVDLNNLLKLAS